MRKFLVPLLILSLLLTALAGCAESPAEQSSQPSAAEPETSAAEPEAPLVSEAPAEQETVAPAEPPQDQPPQDEPQPPAEPEQVKYTVTYPLSEEAINFSLFTSVGSLGQPSSPVTDSLDVFPVFQMATEQTNVHLEYSLTTPETTETKLNLIIVSGDYPTFITGLDMYYVAGRSAAVEDGFVYDLAPYLDEFAPDYCAFLELYPDIRNKITTDSGEIAVFAPKSEVMTTGLTIRQDWLDELGLEVPQTYDELEDVLMAFKTEYNCRNAFLMSDKLVPNNNCISGGYGVNMLRGQQGSLAFMAIDGEVVLYCMTKGFKEYMTMIAGWNEKGLIQDYLQVGHPGTYNSYIGSDDTGLWSAPSSTLTEDWISQYYTGAGNFNAMPIRDVTKTPGERIELGGLAVTINAEAAWSVTTSCTDIENAVSYLNWFYTEQGQMSASFGYEGEAYTMVNGEPEFTELITNNPEYTRNAAITRFVGDNTPATLHEARHSLVNSGNSEKQVLAEEIWYDNRGTAYEYNGDLTIEESEIYAAKAGDIGTYLEEFITKIVEGIYTIENDYDTMMETVKQLGLDQVLSVKQAAYDRYMNR